MKTLNIVTEKRILTQQAEYHLDVNGILHIQSAKKNANYSEIDLDFQLLGPFLEGRMVKMLIKHYEFSEGARSDRARITTQLHNRCSALAITYKTEEEKKAACVFISLVNMNFPMKLFPNKKEAMLWLTSL
jgi:hypothetical protein